MAISKTLLPTRDCHVAFAPRNDKYDGAYLTDKSEFEFMQDAKNEARVRLVLLRIVVRYVRQNAG